MGLDVKLSLLNYYLHLECLINKLRIATTATSNWKLSSQSSPEVI